MLLQEPPAQTERRAWPRYPCRREALLHVDAAPEGGSRSVVVHNISAQGLCLLMDTPLRLGTTIKVGVPHLNRPHLLQAQVVYAANKGYGWLIGCELANRLADEEIQEFLGWEPVDETGPGAPASKSELGDVNG
jgi:hypothetical protein